MRDPIRATLAVAALIVATESYRVPPAWGGEYSPSDVTKVVILGSGTPLPDPHRRGPAVAVIVNGRPYIVDAGEGIWRATGAATPRFGGEVAALAAPNLGHFFLTHLHVDHIIGLPAILLHPWSMGKQVRLEPAQVYGPPGTPDLVSYILKAYRPAIDEFVHGPAQKSDNAWKSVGHVVSGPGLVYEDDNVEVEAFETKHAGFPLTVAYRFTTPDRVVTISGDTVPCAGIEAASRDADVLVHEVYGLDGLANAPWGGDDVESKKKSMGLYHTSTEELARLADKVRPSLLVLYHEQNYSDDPEANVKEIRRFGYQGPLVSSKDQDIY